MADWRRRSIAGGPSPATPNEDNPGALHLDLFYRPSAALMAFPCDGAGGSGAGSSKDLGEVIVPGRGLIREIADEAFVVIDGADDDRNSGDSEMAEAAPLEPQQCQPDDVDGSSQDDDWDAMLYCDEGKDALRTPNEEEEEEEDDSDVLDE